MSRRAVDGRLKRITALCSASRGKKTTKNCSTQTHQIHVRGYCKMKHGWNYCRSHRCGNIPYNPSTAIVDIRVQP